MYYLVISRVWVNEDRMSLFHLKAEFIVWSEMDYSTARITWAGKFISQSLELQTPTSPEARKEGKHSTRNSPCRHFYHANSINAKSSASTKIPRLANTEHDLNLEGMCSNQKCETLIFELLQDSTRFIRFTWHFIDLADAFILNKTYTFQLFYMRIKLTWFTFLFCFTWVNPLFYKIKSFIYFVILMFNSGHILWNTF